MRSPAVTSFVSRPCSPSYVGSAAIRSISQATPSGSGPMYISIHWAARPVNLGNAILSLLRTHPITEAVRCHDEENTPRGSVPILAADLGGDGAVRISVPGFGRGQPVRSEFGISRIRIVDLECYAVLRGIAAVLVQADPQPVTLQHRRAMRRIGTLNHAKAQHLLIKRYRRLDVGYRKRHHIILVRPRVFEGRFSHK